jgi:hypothetical protein
MDPAPNLTPQHHHLMPKRNVFRLKPGTSTWNGKIKMETRQNSTNIVR